MSWLQTLQQWDTDLFRFINGSMSNPVLDAVLPFFREKWFWAPLYLFVAAFVCLNYKKKGWVIMLGLVAAVGLSDFTSSTLVKKNVQRLRPCNDPALVEHVTLRTSCGSGYSFTSSHAANHFAAAVFIIGVFGRLARWVRPAALLWATVIAVSQVYVGVHYPGDIFCGALLGMAIGWWVVLTMRKMKIIEKFPVSVFE
ncbi:MAG TPA: phosphatase PAP2 family protein [Saprospiraceae bacterium]|nr:phosphatase PAP2 family protein [Saprospiraceae bacterium]